MKKTLVALAALAATGAFAQVALTGNLTYGYAGDTTAAVQKGGFGTDTAELYFAASEDLGGGWKIAANMALETGANKGGAAGSLDQVLRLTTPYGLLTAGSIRSADYLSGGVSGVAGIGFDGLSTTTIVTNLLAGGKGNEQGLFSGRSAADQVGFTVPVGAFAFGVTLQESASDLGAGGLHGTNNQRLVSYSGTYASGALVANLNYLQYMPTGTIKNATRGAASYDLGMAKIGAGYVRVNTDVSAAPSITDMLVGVTVPMGAASFGLQLGTRDIEKVGVQTATGLKVAYDLSKRTQVSSTWKRFGIQNQADADSSWNLLLSHSF